MKKLMCIFIMINFLVMSCVNNQVEQEKTCNMPGENQRIETGQYVVYMKEEPLSDRTVVTFSLFAGVYYINKNNPCFSQLHEVLNYSLQNGSDIEFSYQVPEAEIIYAKAIKSPSTP